ncbi:LLM class flavin-dependent oxidoreductase [Raineyella sp. LH-20]|uniref:LLM class flavin-dependent oxidoreductase n=1 Tax=Raineyella sp. LH-20 TaxID=3081204 RepID=UPI0029535500|nr:LLM class flavin-dependent oxidoreductase [Raineyella sp. LH-20]WOP18085.1 LLM class flavin-dependent oxidoreductase [Raineyella sp. LH-20]
MTDRPARTPGREILFNAFDMNCVAHQSPGLWRHPDDRARTYTTLGYWTDLARTLERGLFDGLFLADVLGTYDVYGATNEGPLRTGAQVPVNDPILLVSAMAAVTEHLGFGVTAGTAYEHPYPFARRLATLDHLTEGRVGWNVVTGYLPSAAQNLGHRDQMSHDERYDHADEYLEVIYKLLEGSWEDDAVLDDGEKGFVDPAKVHAINHHGRWFDVPGIAITEPSPQRMPVVYQAGTSPRGVTFAGENAEAVFISSPTVGIMRDSVRKVRAAALAAGRDPQAIRVFAMNTIITAATDEEAWAKFEEYRRYADPEGALVLLSGWTGVDLSRFDLDEPVGNVESNAIRSAVETILGARREDGRPWTVRDFSEYIGVGGFGPILVGSGATVARRLAALQDETDVDGFNLAYAITPGTFEDIVEFVVPELQKLGRYKTAYTPGTLRHKLFGRGDRLPTEHRGSRFRIGGDLSTASDRLESITSQLAGIARP